VASHSSAAAHAQSPASSSCADGPPPNLPWSSGATSLGRDPARALEHIAFTVPFNMSGHLAISVPWDHDLELPPDRRAIRRTPLRRPRRAPRGGGMRGDAPGTAAMARHADALTAPGVDVDRGAQQPELLDRAEAQVPPGDVRSAVEAMRASGNG
jgi:hypothetical protein